MLLCMYVRVCSGEKSDIATAIHSFCCLVTLE